MPSVYLCSPTNSTMFTTCCHVAITDREAKCPVCKGEIRPRSPQERWREAYSQQKRSSERKS